MASGANETYHPLATTNARIQPFVGCCTCRTRHVQCDGKKPTCLACQRAGLQCTGFEKPVVFDLQNGEGQATRLRRLLFTDREREHMCQELTSSIAPHTESELLGQIDEECESVGLNASNFEVLRGPFGVFQSKNVEPSQHTSIGVLNDTSQGSTHPTHPAVLCNDLSQNSVYPSSSYHLSDLQDQGFDYSVVPLSPVRQNISKSIYAGDTPIATMLSPALWGTLDDPSRLSEVLDIPPDCGSSMSTENFSFIHEAPLEGSFSPILGCIASHDNSLLAKSASFLLKYYTSEIIKILTPVRQLKTPWHILFVPHFKHCLAGLTLGEQLNDAELTYFYATLAITALSLGGASASHTWNDQATAHLQRAESHFVLMLLSAYRVPKVAKYKTILMALLAMLYVSMFAGSGQECERYFLEIERFIRIRGLNRKKSRKVRMLHHIYAFERLFHESECSCEHSSSQRSVVQRDVFASGFLSHSLDSLDFSLPEWTDLDDEMKQTKSREMSDNDLHLQHPGVSTGSMYPEIFGVPEEWMFCLSMVIRLGREKQGAEHSATTDPIGPRSFYARAKIVEKTINGMRLKTSNQAVSTTTHPQIPADFADTLHELIYTSLSIFFYRRIYDLDSDMLQHKVLQVRSCLMRCEDSDSGTFHNSAIFIWCAVIAGCEAQDPLVRAFFSSWFSTAARRSGLHLFLRSLSQIEKAWQEMSSV